MNGVGRHERNFFLLEDGSHRPGGKAVGAPHEGSNLILLNELVRKGHCLLGICPVVVVDELHLLPQHPPLLVHLIQSDLHRVEGTGAIRRRRPRKRNQKTDLHRILRPQGERGHQKHRT